jgi:hypothetical protein
MFGASAGVDTVAGGEDGRVTTEVSIVWDDEF